MYIIWTDNYPSKRSQYISNLKKPGCASKRDVLVLMTLQYLMSQCASKDHQFIQHYEP